MTRSSVLQPNRTSIPPIVIEPTTGWWVLPATVVIVCLLVGAWYPYDAISERGIIEVGSAVLWGVGALSAGVVAIKSRPRDRTIQLWLLLMGLLCGARELDLQLWLNPSRIGELGVRFRIDWWLGRSVPLNIKLGWAIIFATIGALVYTAVRKTVAEFKNDTSPVRAVPLIRNPAVALIALTAFLLFLGWVSDDVLRGLLHSIWGAMWEESVEFVGAATFVTAPAAAYRVAGSTSTGESHALR